MSTTHPFVFKNAQPLRAEDRIPVLDMGPFLAQELEVWQPLAAQFYALAA